MICYAELIIGTNLLPYLGTRLAGTRLHIYDTIKFAHLFILIDGQIYWPTYIHGSLALAS